MIDRMAVSGRVRVPLRKKLNPIWWFGNDDEPIPPDWYRAQEPRFTTLKWYLRNPLMNFNSYVIGVQDRNFTIYGSAPVAINDLVDLNQTGWNWKVILLWSILPVRPWFSLTTKGVIFHTGWNPAGRFQIKLTLRNRKGQVV